MAPKNTEIKINWIGRQGTKLLHQAWHGMKDFFLGGRAYPNVEAGEEVNEKLFFCISEWD